jgi:hypothetical protein
MTNPTQPGHERIRVALDNDEVIELDGGTLTLDGEASPSVVLRLAPWRARSLSVVLAEWSAAANVFHRPPLPEPTEMELSRVLDLASAAAGDEPDNSSTQLAPPNPVPQRARLAALTVLDEREPRLTATQRIALIDGASWWLTEANGGAQLARALLNAACTDSLAAEHAYLALIDQSVRHAIDDIT